MITRWLPHSRPLIRVPGRKKRAKGEIGMSAYIREIKTFPEILGRFLPPQTAKESRRWNIFRQARCLRKKRGLNVRLSAKNV